MAPKNLTFPKYLSLLGSQNDLKIGFYSIFVVGGDKIWISKFGFLAFFEDKITKIDILNPKLIVPDDNQQFWVHFLVEAKSRQKWYFLASIPIFKQFSHANIGSKWSLSRFLQRFFFIEMKFGDEAELSIQFFLQMA